MVEQIGDCTLYLGDCLEVMPTLGKVDAVVTDPPYLLESGGDSQYMNGGKFSSAVYNNNGRFVHTPIGWPDFMPAIYEAMGSGHVYFMANNRHVHQCINAALDAGFRFHNLLVWDKCAATPNRWYMKCCEFIVFMFKGEAAKINDCSAQQLIKCPIVYNAAHPTEKPADLMKGFIGNSTSKGQTVLDPFMGSGTTGVACVQLGRKFIGIEIDKGYFDIACKRIEEATRQGRLFDEPKPKAIQEPLL